MWTKVEDELPPDGLQVMVYGKNTEDWHVHWARNPYSIASYHRARLVTHYGPNCEYPYAEPFMAEARWIAECAVYGHEWNFCLEITHWAHLPGAPDNG